MKQRECICYKRFHTSLVNSLFSNFTVRLVNGAAPYEGRVEILYHGIWGTICDDFWDLLDTHVVCRQLGFDGAKESLSSAAFGQGTGVIWLDDVGCYGNETAISRCRHKGWRASNCGHWEDASVRCIPPGERLIF